MLGKMPDITRQVGASIEDTLNWVGMERIALPFTLQAHDVHTYPVQTKTHTYVNLVEPKAKGIHMSRLYLALEDLTSQPVTPELLKRTLQSFVGTHENLSDAAKVEFEFELMLKRSSLLSQNSGWKSYACRIEALQQGDETKLVLQVTIPYSSTCPCSAALARQLIQEAFISKFGDTESVDSASIHAWLGTTEGIVATPHSQRSDAQVRLEIQPSMPYFPFLQTINLVESVLKTAVQTAVKREDEQEFARLNGQNLMFVEDAARKLKRGLSTLPSCLDYEVRVSHYESLHAHNAVAVAQKD